MPKVKRVDAIQSFVSQETPIVRITDADGAVGTGYSYTIGTGGSFGDRDADRRTLAPALIGREPARSSGSGATCCSSPMRPRVGAITALALAAIDTALWDLRCRKAGLPLHVMAGGAQNTVRLYTTEGGWLHLDRRSAGRGRAAGQGGRLRRRQDQGRPAAVHEDVARLGRCARRSAPASRSSPTPTRPSPWTRRSAARGAIRAARYRLVRGAAAGRRCRRPCAPARSRPRCRSRSAKSFTASRISANISQRGACSIVQVDVARIGGITPWLKVAHLAETFNMPVCPHFLMELHVALCCAVPNARWVEYIPQLDGLTEPDDDYGTAMPCRATTPGLGIAWDWKAIERQHRPPAQPWRGAGPQGGSVT